MIHVVLFEPEIPQNTGNIMRTCVATGCMLHLIEPLGFDISERAIRRSGMDYRKDLSMEVHPNWDDFYSKNQGRYLFLTRYGHKAPSQFDFSEETQDIYLVFGKESTGIDKHILKDHLDDCARLPMVPSARSLNLSNTVAIAVYEVLRQRNYEELSTDEFLKGADFLNDFE